VFPALLVAYTGQAAYLIHDPSVIGATFYKSIPNGIFWPEFIVATAAAIIASQAMISATYSIVEQSMALGCFPKCKVIYTSKKFAGQIYIPEINWILMVLTIIVTIGFKTSTQIGNAYGVAVVSVMLVTTCFLTLIILMVWQKKSLDCITLLGCVLYL
jgi:KUP system potassium uptake protein